MRVTRYGRGPLAAVGGVVSALAILAWSGWRAVVVEPVTARVQEGLGVERVVVSPAAAVSRENILAAVDHDPFHPERKRPQQRFRLPARLTSGSEQSANLSESMVLIGTVVYRGGGGAAVVALPGSAPQILHVGERLGDLFLQRVDRGEATFVTSNGSVVVIRAPKPGG